ncbi:MAG: 1-acyl-sn-glycerol-3-phosphate acyltransferase [Gammaproteobacteria bacterium]|nr:1-acyl-sn-glycerol-3-phosphate acyltransferase [Gammaproteobacteria bacterium]
MRFLNTVWTLSRISLHIVRCFGMMLGQFIRHGRHWSLNDAGKQAIQQWMSRLCVILGVEVEVEGEVSEKTVLMVCNHISWLDIIVLSSHYPYSFLSKAEIKHWPIVGLLAASSGTLFIKRHSLSGLKHAVADVGRRLKQGRSVCLFPEGTTTAQGVQPFKSGLFVTAAQAGVAVQPVAIEYLQEDAAYVDDDHFLSHLLKQAGKHTIHVRLRFLPPIQADGDRRNIAQQAQAVIAETLATNKDVAAVA